MGLPEQKREKMSHNPTNTGNSGWEPQVEHFQYQGTWGGVTPWLHTFAFLCSADDPHRHKEPLRYLHPLTIISLSCFQPKYADGL